MGDKLKVVLSGIYYPVAILRYFQEALLADGNVELHTVGPYTGSYIPWAGGMFVQCPLPQPNLQLSMNMNSLPIGVVETQLPWEPDVWIQVDAGYYFKDKPKHGLNFFVGTDPHCLDYSHQRTLADKFFCMQMPYMETGDVWLPYAYSPQFHYPMVGTGPLRTNDVGIIGADERQGDLYRHRKEVMDALQGTGHQTMSAFGPAYGDACRAWNTCKVGLNWSTRLDTTARVFEVMACKVALATNRTPDLKALHFVEGQDYIGFDTVLEATEMISHALASGSWRAISENGREAVRPHTWTSRVSQVLSHVV